jgi:hypothetical protein
MFWNSHAIIVLLKTTFIFLPLRFAAKIRTPRTRVDGQTRDEIIKEITDFLAAVFVLCYVRKTLVGDAGTGT